MTEQRQATMRDFSEALARAGESAKAPLARLAEALRPFHDPEAVRRDLAAVGARFKAALRQAR